MLFIILLPLCFAIPTLPEVFQSFSVAHPSLSALSAVAVVTSPRNDVYITGSAYPRHDKNVSFRHRNPELKSLPFIAHLSPNASLIDLHVLEEAITPTHLLLHHNHLFLIANTHQNNSIYVNKFTPIFKQVWKQPLVFGSPGIDSVSAVAVDTAGYFRHIFVAGRVGGRGFEPPERSDPDLHAVDIEQHVIPVEARVEDGALDGPTETDGPMQSDVPIPTDLPSGFSQEVDSDADLFVTKIHPDTGELVKAVQLELDRDNSADAIFLDDGILYACVNSFDGAPFDPTGTSSLHTFRAKDLAHREIHLPSRSIKQGDFMHAMSGDNAGNIYMAGFSLRGNSMENGVYLIRKYSTKKNLIEWEQELGKHVKVEPKVCLTVGKRTGDVFVSGHTAGLYKAQTPDGKSSGNELLRLPLTVFSAYGHELISWDRISPYPLGYEEIAAITMDKDENIVYTGTWLNSSDGLSGAIVGSFGASSFTARAADVEESETGMLIDNKKSGMATSTVGLICLAAGVGLIVVGGAMVYGRSKHARKKGLVMGPSYNSGGEDDIDDLLDIEVGSDGTQDDLERQAQRAIRRKTADGEEVGGSAGPM